jgi:3D (Asp-Asp-Asp) domain-containing protein
VRARRTAFLGCAAAGALVIAGACASAAAEERVLVVTATAYNSLPGQTRGDPRRGAWGDLLKPGMKAIAVSRDLLAEGLRRGVRVRIEGLEGEYVVLDKMNRRWRRKIDIYMGDDLAAARRWGRRKVTIRWEASGEKRES